MATDARSTHVPRGSINSTADRSARKQLSSGELWLTSALLFVFVIALYWFTPTALNTFDAVSYANQIGRLYPRTADFRWLYHPHHLLFNAIGYLVWRACQALGYHGGPLAVLQRVNTLVGAIGVVIFYHTLRHLMQRSRWLPFLMALGLAVTFGYWICATDGRVNMPSNVLMLAAFYALCRQMCNATPRGSALVGFLAGAAVLFHESAGLFLIVGLAGLLVAEQPSMTLLDAAKRMRRTVIATYLGAWSATVLLPYIAVGTLQLGLRSPYDFHQWTASYSELGWWWNFHILHNIRLDAYALRHAAFVEPPGKQGTFSVSRAAPAALRGLYFATLAGWFVAAYAFCTTLPLLWRSHQRRIVIVCLIWIVAYGLFFTVWSPEYFVFKVPMLFPITVLLALALTHYRARRGGVLVNWIVGLWIILYAMLNIFASIAPNMRAGVSPFQREAQYVRSHTQPGDLIIVAGAGDTAQYEVDIPYFANRDVLSLHSLLTHAHENEEVALRDATAQVAQTLAAGHSVYLLNDVRYNKKTFEALHKRHPEWGAAEMNSLFAPFKQSLGWNGKRGPVWRLTLKTPKGS